MKKKDYVLISGIISIIVLVMVQFFIIKDIWKEKDVMFDLKYKTLSREAMDQLRRASHTDGFDNALDLIDKYAQDVWSKEINNGKTLNDSDLASLKKEVFEGVTKILNELQGLSTYLSDYFKKQGFESDFKYKIEINSLQLLDFGSKLDIYSSPDFVKMKQGVEKISPPHVAKIKPRILVNNFFRERNYYSLNFDYYIDFSHKQALVLRSMTVYLLLSAFSIIVVVIIFLVTYRNLMEEKRLSNLKTDFINNMTHELKTPLSTITVAGKTLEIERIRTDSDKVLETAKLIGKQSVHLNQLINLILEISMWERTQFQLEKKTVEIEDLLKDIVESFKTGCGNCAGIEQKYDLQGLRADIDLVYFTTMINNLLTNAVKYSDKEPKINVEASRDREFFSISITDNGVGIEKSEQKHIFDKFYRVSQGNIHKTKGLGLGLYYVKRIAESHGGDVTVSSKPGKGSIFTITMPY
ncbi:MAG TPA: HAMP domain-containing sensor histidine kinase [Bacteroidales bacterium]|nr:HAMP domain-containing sensor histidine kinase [Bacteroidales bacterium]